MGKALIFSGLNVQNPLQTLEFEEEDLDVTRIAECFSRITITQFSALKTLIRSLKVAGTFDKLSYLILPAIADNVDEAILNVLVDSDSIPSTTYMSLTNNMLFVSNTVNVTAFVKPDTLNTRNLAMGVFTECSDYPFPEGAQGSETIMKVNTGYVVYRNGAKIGYENGVGVNIEKSFIDTKEKFGMSTSIDNLSSVMVYAEDTVVPSELSSSATVKVTDTASVLLSGPPYVDGGSRYYRAFTGGFKLIWISSLLTQTELVATHEAFDAFITAVSGS